MILDTSFLYFPDGNWPPCWIFKSIKFYMLTRSEGSRPAHHHAKFSRNCSIQSRDIAIFRFSKWAAAAILDFWNRKILLAIVVKSVETHQCAKLHKNRSIGCEDIKIFSAILDLFGGIFGPPTVSTWGLYHSAKFGYDRCSSFIIWTFNIWHVWLENPYSRPQYCFFGNLIP